VIKFLEKEELACFLRLADSDGLEMDSLIFTTIRTVRIDEGLVRMLKRYEVKQKEIKLQKGSVYEDNRFIFARNDGHPQLRKVVETRLKLQN
jgi:hypothetical protein